MLPTKYSYLKRSVVYFAGFFVFLGVFFLIILPIITDFTTRYQLQFIPGYAGYDTWVVNKEPYYQDYYFFNITNPDEIISEGAKPRLEQVGPYRFAQYKHYRNVTHNDNDTITFYYTKTYHYVKDETTRDWRDVITTVNPLAVIIANKARYMGYFARMAASVTLSSTSKLFVNHTVEEFLFKGYDDKLLNMLKSIPFIDKSTLPDRFGWEYKKNGTDLYVGPFNVYSNIDDDNFGKIVTYKNKPNNGLNPGKCGEFRGSLGDMNTMDVRKDNLQVYTTDLCVALDLKYEQEESVKGVLGYRFATDKKTFFDNGWENQENECFCQGNCLPRGVLNMSACWQDAPIFASLPHFYQADGYYGRMVDGLKPDADKHDLFLTVEPKTGKVIHIGIRLQINMLVEPVRGIRMFEKFPRTFLPVVYVNQVIKVPDGDAFKLSLAQFPSSIRNIVGFPLLIGGLCLFGTVYFLRLSRRLSKTQQHKHDKMMAIIEESKPLNALQQQWNQHLNQFQ